jgi:hypothetical protein
LEIEGVTYNWRQDEFPEKAFGDRTEIGFIAQELEKYFPELVNTDKDGYKSVQYSHMVPVLLEAIKEQQALISEIQSQNFSLTSELSKSSLSHQSLVQEMRSLRSEVEMLKTRTDSSSSK